MSTVPIENYKKAIETLKQKDDQINILENEKLVLEEKVEEYKADCSDKPTSKADGKTYSSGMRMKVFDCIINKVPTANIPTLLSQMARRNNLGVSDDVPQRSAIEMMSRELGTLAELQAAEVLLNSENITIGFDATTQEDIHINSIHFTTENECFAAAVDVLPGGTAEDYADHICDSVDSLAKVYSYFHEDVNYNAIRSKMISNIANSMSDRCPANHAAIRLVNSSWIKSLNELNCHLHPLDSFATSCRSSLKKCEPPDTTRKLFGKDCMAANLIVQINKLRYKNGKGDPLGFVTFLDSKGIARGILPRYRGNRLHIMFLIAGRLIEYYDTFVELFKTGTSCGGLRCSILQDFQSDVAKDELQVLGILGKTLTGPWMKTFYTSAGGDISHVDGIEIVKGVLPVLKDICTRPETLLSTSKDVFGNELDSNSTLTSLKQQPKNIELFSKMIVGCLHAIIQVVEHQYSKYFQMNLTEELRKETATARSHNIDAEELMGMFSILKQKAPNATICYLSCRMRAIKNRTVDYLDSLTEERRDEVLMKAIHLGRMQRQKRKMKQRDLRLELQRRQKAKEQAKSATERKKLEKKLKNFSLDTVRLEYPNLDFTKRNELEDILNGKIVGRKACHIWYEDEGLVVYNAKVEKLKARGNYSVAYWSRAEDYEDATDYNVSMYALAADLLHGDLEFC